MKKRVAVFLATVFCLLMGMSLGNSRVNAKADEIDSVGKNVPIYGL